MTTRELQYFSLDILVQYEEVSVVLIGKLFGNPNLIFAKQFHRLRTFVSRSRDGL